ncbi:uncharacterized protein LOC121389696 [Gigantopelta aegis]|uniref:uncharacterized protein LOC121389696 n=1 Tax=Gigantopelta aegis TaxID=1735272 RepID=UPI001B88E1E3|nr:uncharacterized protein LOC121389696 [Gigantopelta aegis]
MAYDADTTNTTHISEGGLQVYLRNHQHVMTLLKDVGDDCDGGTRWAWSVLGDCFVRTEQIAGFYCGLLAVPLWCSAHVLVYLTSMKTTESTRSFKTTMFPHLLADLFNVCGALMSYQFSSQIVFAFSVLIVNCAICIHRLFNTPASSQRVPSTCDTFERK